MSQALWNFWDSLSTIGDGPMTLYQTLALFIAGAMVLWVITMFRYFGR